MQIVFFAITGPLGFKNQITPVPFEIGSPVDVAPSPAVSLKVWTRKNCAAKIKLAMNLIDTNRAETARMRSSSWRRGSGVARPLTPKIATEGSTHPGAHQGDTDSAKTNPMDSGGICA